MVPPFSKYAEKAYEVINHFRLAFLPLTYDRIAEKWRYETIMKIKAVYAGTFDPLTLGHLDLIERSSEIFDAVILAVARDTPKNTLFTLDERVVMAKEVTKKIQNVTVTSFSGLLVNYVKKVRASVLIRGLRAFSDFENEFQMALTNRKLSPGIETLFMMPKEKHSYLSSSAVKEVAQLGGNIRGFVPTAVAVALNRKIKKCTSK